MSEPPIDIQGLAKRYGEFEAVRDLSLQVAPGELFALLGPNGAGKTTTLRMLMGILQPTAGTARVCGLNCFTDRVAVKRLVGYLPDEPTFYDYLRGRELLNFVGEMHGLTRDQISERVAPLIERLDLKDVMEEYAANYSKGMRKKLALICALLHDPQVLILDEPTNGLDPYATRALLELVRAQAAAGKTVFYSTHLLDQAERLCTRVAILYQGKLAAIGSLHELRSRCAANSTLEEIFFSVTGDSANGAIPSPPPPPAGNGSSAPRADATHGPPSVEGLEDGQDADAVPTGTGDAAIEPERADNAANAPTSEGHTTGRVPDRAAPPTDNGLRMEVRQPDEPR